MMESSQSRLPRGYSVPKRLKPLVAWLCKTSLTISTLTALSDWSVIVLCAMAGVWSVTLGWIATAMLHLFIIFPICARSLRGSENLVHEGSHCNFCRTRNLLNDVLVNLFSAVPLCQEVTSYRESHVVPHHAGFGSVHDPDKRRYSELNIDNMSREHLWMFIVSILGRIPKYAHGFYSQFSKNKKQIRLSLLWHGVLNILGIIYVDAQFYLYWMLYFLVPFVFYLPVLRFVAESEKHRYDHAVSEFSSTFSHLGFFQCWFLHPHGDAYHLLHHMIPGVPHWKLWLAHWLLSKLDEDYNKGAFRTKVLSDPITKEQIAKNEPTKGDTYNEDQEWDEAV